MTHAASFQAQSIVRLFRQLTDFIESIQSAEDRSKAYGLAYRMCHDADTKERKTYHDSMLAALSSVDEVWRQVELGFELASLLAEVDSGLARKLIKQSADLRGTTPLIDSQIAHVYVNTIRLAVRATPDLAKLQPAEFSTYRQRLLALIGAIPSQSLQRSSYLR